MELSALRIFKAVAEEGSVTLAASRLNRVQSNVSARLTQLEESLGVTLFHRASRKLQITSEGERLLAYADRLLQLADEAQAALRPDQQPAGQLRIGSMETTAAARLPQVLAAFNSMYPAVDLVLDTAPTDHLIDGVLKHRLDLALVAGPIEHPELAQRVVFKEELVLITNHVHPPVSSPRDLERRTLLAFRSGCTYRRRLESWFAEGDVAPARVSEFGSYEAILGCVAAGMGVAMMPRELVEQRKLAKTVRQHALPPHIANVETMLVWRKDVLHHPARTAFAESLGAAAN
ncbi:LysR family transcriptional regulator [Duganella aceris]|jgi:DNA-binding transcriptional LysR family regulator|uniref:LysR family transcriptional regulator n=1 Tax=Duganella aceris TaxID=2703883 RepID=A0ABX0FJV6_9BURK|nr:LysR family transcriptional regulator [Duganella aceris]NGZ84815.1 LysR family transcriptional regulator [Duganella aceris]